MGEGPEVAMLSEALKARFDSEVKGHPVVIYMKGNVLFPRCGFSARAVDLLKPFGPLFTVDVLNEPEVRDGIKEYSSWPTIPQVYIRGQFVGGSDIVAELASRGELEAMVKGG
jgi:monothiol glutaredoxin